MVPVDFTSHTNKLVEYAVFIARSLDAGVTFVHIAESFSGYEMLMVHPSFDKISAELKEKAEQLMANLVDDNREGLAAVTGEVMIGDPAEKLLEYAEKEDFDMMIVGTHGTRGLEKVLMGSVADRLAQNSPCPILIVNPSRHLRDR
jgi:nucleotide-binding universal stress UspA family protein